MANSVEQGDIYFFYRNKVDVQQAEGLEDIQRLYLVLAPDKEDRKRLLMVGKKRMPEILPGEAKSTEREWLMVATVSRGDGVARALKPVSYETKTQGKQRQSEALPVAAGRYKIVKKKSSTRLSYQLDQPEKIGKAQRALGIESQASYVISVRNPDVQVKGFPDDKPRYPQKLKKRFADERWLDVDDANFLNYKNAQLLLIGAHRKIPEDEGRITGKSQLFKRLGLDRDKWPSEALVSGEFAQVKGELRSRKSSGDRSKGGERGGAAATQSASASGVAKALKGKDFPCNRKSLVDYAKRQEADEEIVDLLAEFPARQFKSMSDVQKALGEVR